MSAMSLLPFIGSHQLRLFSSIDTMAIRIFVKNKSFKTEGPRTHARTHVHCPEISESVLFPVYKKRKVKYLREKKRYECVAAPTRRQVTVASSVSCMPTLHFKKKIHLCVHTPSRRIGEVEVYVSHYYPRR